MRRHGGGRVPRQVGTAETVGVGGDGGQDSGRTRPAARGLPGSAPGPPVVTSSNSKSHTRRPNLDLDPGPAGHGPGEPGWRYDGDPCEWLGAAGRAGGYGHGPGRWSGVRRLGQGRGWCRCSVAGRRGEPGQCPGAGRGCPRWLRLGDGCPDRWSGVRRLRPWRYRDAHQVRACGPCRRSVAERRERSGRLRARRLTESGPSGRYGRGPGGCSVAERQGRARQRGCPARHRLDGGVARRPGRRRCRG